MKKEILRPTDGLWSDVVKLKGEIGMKECIACHSGQIKQVDIITRDDVFTLIENSEVVVGPQSQKIIKFVCLNCGFINLYAEDYF